MFGPVESFDLVALEERVLERWREHDIIEHVRALRADAEPWVFYEGPPTANGRPGLHHVWARAFKDLYPRFQTMRGKQVPRKGGWDCHGLPVELEVEKELGFTAKHQIEEYGIAAFNERCRNSVQRYVEDWSALTSRSGVWIDTKDAYWTLSNSYVESVWWLVKQMWDKGLLYEGHRVSPYCTRCGTALSSHEMGQPEVYQDVSDQTAYVRFPLRDDDADLLVWTTTPWTLISNVAAAVGPDMDYVRVHEPDGRDLIMATAAAERLFGADAPYDVIARFRGSELVGRRYRRPYTFLELPDDAGEIVVAAEFVTAEDGSGIVHLAPAFGEDDAEVGRREGLPVLNPVTADGTFDTRVKPWFGVHVKAADPGIIADLLGRDLLVREESHVHSYPHCWRCKTPLIYWAKTSWFARTSAKRTELLRENEAVGWYPEHIKRGRFGKWLENNVDWALSRDRYWGTTLPMWRCTEGHDTCIGSLAELATLAGRDLTDLDLHRPYVDEVTFPCPDCSAKATRVAPVLDAWFDSGSMPSAQQHFPFAGQDAALPPPHFPADFICEAIDQTRGWFYSLLAVNTLVFDTSPYRNVVCLGFIVDGEGRKMSKSLGNVIDPWHVFKTHGSDGTRWWMFSASQPWTNRRAQDDAIRESTRQTLMTLWNVFSFFATYADIDGWRPSEAPLQPTHVLDRWILGELDATIVEVTDALEGFDALRGSTRIARFVDDLSNWYVRRSRPRFWKASDAIAHATLHRCLVVTAELLAPFTPFLAEELWTTLTDGLTVHGADWPTPSGFADADLSTEMQAARQLVALGRAARTDAKMKVRQPLRRALLLHPGVTLGDGVRAEIADELNVKALEDITSLGGVVQRTVAPSFRLLGPRLGPKVNAVKAGLASADGSALADQLEAQGYVEIAGERIDASEVEVRADPRSDVALAQEGTFAVALDLELDDDLRVEGTARELVRAVNDLRKDAGFEIADRVRVVLDATGAVADAVARHGRWIEGEVLATALSVGDAGAGAPTIEIDGASIAVLLEKTT
ncbi:MAG: isoleucyl-tRNA synthetase [Actinomycetota bacterium]|nr:isoleucyl-tRNA synthetase [Actinomycetota bacterium]